MPDGRVRILPEALESVAIGDAYATLGTLTNPTREIIIFNGTTGNITISYNGGTTDHQVLAASATFVFDISSNRAWDSDFAMAAGTVISVKRTTAATGAGTVFLTTFYAA